MLTRSYKAITARPIAILAVLLVALMLYAASDSAYAQSEMSVNYYEKDDSPVLTLVASDPEEVDTVVWTLLDSHQFDVDGTLTAIEVDGAALTADDVIDHEDFKIVDGVLSFKSSPSFETPKGGATNLTLEGTPGDGTNTYKVVVQASDGGTSNDNTPETGESMNFLSWFKVTVTVMDVEEKGSITLRPHAVGDNGDPGDELGTVTLLQPHVGVRITASLSDPDGPAEIPDANITWRWYRTSDKSEQGDVILNDDGTAEHDMATHTPRDTAGASDVGKYLRVKATYEDRRGKRKTAEAITPYPVLAAIVNTNTLPKFAADTAERTVAENTPGGTAIGRPVTAVDPDDEKLSYSLVSTTTTDGNDVDGDSARDHFTIESETGQIKVGGGLNFETAKQYVVRVVATDSRSGQTVETGANPHVIVTINVTDVDEMPDIAPDTTSAAMMIRHAGGNAIEYVENKMQGDPPTPDLTVATYVITDDDEGTPVLSVSGDDAGMFTILYDATNDDASPPVPNDAKLSFKEMPDFEDPMDENGDNIYEVTIEADDGNNKATLDVTVKVTNGEENGMVTLSPQQPLIGHEVTATVSDPDGGFGADGGLTAVTWQWAWAAQLPAEDEDCPAADAETVWTDISKATNDTYTPKAIDDEDCLRVTTTYLDRTYRYAHAPNDGDDGDDGDAVPPSARLFNEEVQAVSGVVREDPANSQPEFPASVARFVPENTPMHKYVGDPVTATDDDSDDLLTYSLDDESSFYIASADVTTNDLDTDQNDIADRGQIRVGDLTKLDHEDDDRYTVTVTATDSTSTNPDAFASTAVAIHVTDVDERPDVWVLENGDQVRGEFSIAGGYNEKGMAPVLRLMAEDPEGVRSIVWSLVPAEDTVDIDGDGTDDVVAADVADSARFKISGDGELSFTSPPNFEAGSVNDDGEDEDVYHVTVQASDGGTTYDTSADAGESRKFLNWFKVTVEVNDVEEDGSIKLVPTNASGAVLLQPQVGVEITATLSDPDNTPSAITTGITWEWHRQARGSSTWDKITNAPTDGTYEPSDTADPNDPNPPSGETNRIDVGDRLRVTATYTDDPSESRKTAQKVIDNPVLGALVSNSPPEFPSDTARRRMNENAAAGTPVGAPVTATDPDRESGDTGPNRMVSYWLAAANGDNDNAEFSIDEETGQIKVATPQDFENASGATTDDVTKYVVEVMATDSSAEANSTASVTVTVDLVDLDDAPKIALGDAATVITHAAGNAMEVAEGAALRVIFTVTDDDGGTPALSLSGADAGMFEIGDLTAIEVADAGEFEAAGALEFSEMPDFEDPADSNSNNIYEVTIVADDGRNTTTMDVTVKVTNAEEDGEVTLSYQQPLIGSELTAAVTDPDGGFDPASGAHVAGVTAVTWEWHGTTANTYRLPAECPGADEATDWALVKIDGYGGVLGEVAIYEPKSADEGRCLRATAMYLDRTYVYAHAPEDDTDDGQDRLFNETARVVSGVVRVDPENKAPAFAGPEDRFVPEKTPGHKYVGDPVTASDPGDSLVYELGGDDQTSFYIAEVLTMDDDTTSGVFEQADAGRIRVGSRTELDYEDDDTYTVTVTATDTAGATDTTDVTITVVDVDEAPTITVYTGPENMAPEFRDGDSTTRSVREGSAAGTDVGAPVAATDAEDGTLTYALGGDDAGSFDLDTASGQISVGEGTMLDDDVMDSYSVTVTVDDGSGGSDSIDVTINVTDMQYGCSGPSAADCEALLEAMPKLLGSDSTRSLNWAVGTPIAEWDGVRKLSESGRVEWLYLHGVSAKDATDDAPARAEVKLNGTIAVELADLDGLTRLYLHRNNLTGGIPGALSGLNNLVWLRLYDNMLSGGIPDLSGMDSLERLYIHENMLSGEIPMSLGSLSNLTHMLLQRNDLTGEIPAMLGGMETLVWLGLYDNMLSGGIPMELGSLSILQRLYLHGNMLTGEVPMEIGNLSALTNLWLSRNMLTGELPSSLDDLTNLERVRISGGNAFTGCVPAALDTGNDDIAGTGLSVCESGN